MFYKKCIIYTIIELNSKHYYKQLFLELQHKQYDLLLPRILQYFTALYF